MHKAYPVHRSAVPEGEDVHGRCEVLGHDEHVGSYPVGGGVGELLERVDEPLGSNVARPPPGRVEEEREIRRVVLSTEIHNKVQ